MHEPVEEIVGENRNESQARYPTHTWNKPSYLSEYIVDDISYTVDYCNEIANMPEIPTNYQQAVKSPVAEKWQKAMHDEVNALEDNDTYELVPPPKDRQVVGGKWVYAIKTDQKGDKTHKAQYVAKGYSQVAEIDYHKTFSPTTRMSSIRALIQCAVQNDMGIHQMDVKTAYLNAPIDCKHYMEQPEGFEKRGKNRGKLMCKLNKSLY